MVTTLIAPLIASLILATSAIVSAQSFQWEQVGTPIYGGSVLSISVDREGRTYAGTYASGVLRSTDGGEHWLSPEGAGGTLLHCQVHAFAMGGDVLSSTNDGLYLSTDAGVTWDSVAPSGLVVIDHRTNWVRLFGASTAWHSTDRGRTWQHLGDSIPTSPVRCALILDTLGGILLAGDRSVFRSEDSGRTWVCVADSLGRSKYSSIHQIHLLPDGSLIAVGFRLGVLRSTDGGSTWNAYGDGMPTTEWTKLAAAPDGRLVAVDDSGRTWLSTNNGERWSATGTTLGANPHTLVFDGDARVLAAYDFYGVEVSIDSGRTFKPAIEGLVDGFTVPQIAVDEFNRVHAGAGRYLFRFDETTGEWMRLPLPKSPLAVTPLALAGDGWIVAGVVQSLDGGETWRVEDDGLFSFGRTLTSMHTDRSTSKVFATTISGIYVFERTGSEWGWPRLGGIGLAAVVAHPSGALFSGGIDLLMFRSTDGGNEWVDMDDGLPENLGKRTNDIAVDRFGSVFAATNVGVFRSTDVGTSWHRVPVGADSIAAFARLLSNPKGLIVAVTGGYQVEVSRIYVSNDGGDTWTEESNRPPGMIQTLALDSAGRLYAGTPGGRVYRTTGTTSSAPEINPSPATRAALSVRPMPASEEMYFDVELSASSHVTVRLRDVLGRVVLCQEAGYIEAGSRLLRADLTGVGTGVHIAELVVNGDIVASRMVLVR